MRPPSDGGLISVLTTYITYFHNIENFVKSYLNIKELSMNHFLIIMAVEEVLQKKLTFQKR